LVRRLRLGFMLAMVFAMTLLVAIPALAEVIDCADDRDDRCLDRNDNDDADRFEESRIDDLILAGGGADEILADLFENVDDVDEVRSGAGGDTINVRDEDNDDIVNCGAGTDEVRANNGDDIANNCERVR
jgi:hypothetical protein